MIHLDLNLVQRNDLTGYTPVWLTLLLSTNSDRRAFERWDASELRYSPARPWLYTARSTEPSILVNKRTSQSHIRTFTDFGRRHSRVQYLCDGSMQGILHSPIARSSRSAGEDTGPFVCPHGITLPISPTAPEISVMTEQGLPHSDNTDDLDHKMLYAIGTDAFACNIDILGRPLIIFLLYAWCASDKRPGIAYPRAKVCLEAVCPESRPEYYTSLRNLLLPSPNGEPSTTTQQKQQGQQQFRREKHCHHQHQRSSNPHLARVLGDYVFQFYADALERSLRVVDDGSHHKTTMAVQNTEDGNLIEHRF
ncbi:hypothetical protein GE09DRAFT_345828 [Coniochaeta sp. 2T2.1]|nr:hypothetical protein GE09DRAFT_345828 [Coniochaeta sp. 2T2.1]